MPQPIRHFADTRFCQRQSIEKCFPVARGRCRFEVSAVLSEDLFRMYKQRIRHAAERFVLFTRAQHGKRIGRALCFGGKLK